MIRRTLGLRILAAVERAHADGTTPPAELAGLCMLGMALVSSDPPPPPKPRVREGLVSITFGLPVSAAPAARPLPDTPDAIPASPEPPPPPDAEIALERLRMTQLSLRLAGVPTRIVSEPLPDGGTVCRLVPGEESDEVEP